VNPRAFVLAVLAGVVSGLLLEYLRYRGALDKLAKL